MTTILKNKQFSFKTNDELLEKAKKIFARQDFDVTSALNLYLQKVVSEEKIPFSTTTEEETQLVFQELKAEIAKGFNDYRAGKVSSFDEVFSEYGL